MPKKLEIAEGGPPFEGLTFLTAKSRALRGRGDVTLFVPVQAKRLSDVPLIVLLHGAYGSHWNWTVMGGAHRTTGRLIEERKLPPVVLAMPSDGLWGDGSGYLPHGGQDFERWIVEDVPQAARAAAACLSSRSPVFMCGLSMGGFGALRIGAKYPARYRGLSGHSSITHFDQMMKYVAEEPARFGAAPEDHGVLETMLRQRDSLPPFRFDCGVKDPLVRHNRQLHKDLTARDIAHRYDEFPGGHTWDYWTAHLEDSLLFFAEILNAPKTKA